MSANNVVIFGESGGGKSSTVNLLMGREVATVSDRAIGCTFQFETFSTESYNLYDTVGLSEGSKGTRTQSFAVNQLINLLKSLEDGVSLLVFVMEKGRIKKSLDENYKLFKEAICMGKVPVVLLITHCEMEMDLGQWWKENKTYFDQLTGNATISELSTTMMKFAAVISGCCMNPKKAPQIMQPTIKQLNDSTLSQLRRVIQTTMLIPGWKLKGGWSNWLKTIVMKAWKMLSDIFGFPWTGEEELDFETRLENYFLQQGCEPAVAKQQASDIARGI